MNTARPIKVLIVEDELDTARMIGMLLEHDFSAGYAIAVDCQSARSELESGSFDIVTLDYQLPDGNGLELLQEIKSMDQSPPVIMVTGHGDEQVATQSFRFGASSYVVKDQRLTSLLTDAVEHAMSEIALRSAEEEIAMQKNELQRYLNIAGVLVAVTNNKGVISLINKKGCEILGREEEEILGRSFKEFMPSEAWSSAKSHLSDLITGDLEHVEHDETEIITGSGERRTVSWHSTPIKDSEGKVYCVLSSGEDVTDRKQAEAKYKTIIQTAMDGFFITDAQGKIMEVNDSYLSLTGYSRDELLDMSVSDIEAALQPEEVAERIGEIIKKGHDRFETRHRGKDGRIIDIDVCINVLKAHEQLFVFLRDITERKKRRTELEKLVEEKTIEIQRINSELERYAHIVSHEIRGPLSSAYGALNMLLGSLLESNTGPSNEEIEELAGIIERNVGKSIELAEDLLRLAEAGQVPFGLEPVNISTQVGEILAGKKKEIEKRGITIEMDADLGEIIASPIHIYQVFSNIIENSIKHNNKKDLIIEIHNLENKDHEHRYLIRDNGKGIQDEVRDALFLPFQGKTKGSTGIGLSIVENILRTYRGEIKAYNDNGACFDFTIYDYQPGPTF